jgi:hypothetical protein
LGFQKRLVQVSGKPLVCPIVGKGADLFATTLR